MLRVFHNIQKGQRLINRVIMRTITNTAHATITHKLTKKSCVIFLYFSLRYIKLTTDSSEKRIITGTLDRARSERQQQATAAPRLDHFQSKQSQKQILHSQRRKNGERWKSVSERRSVFVGAFHFCSRWNFFHAQFFILLQCNRHYFDTFLRIRRGDKVATPR